MILIILSSCSFRYLEKNTGAQHAAQVARNSQRPMTLSELFLVGPGAKSRLLLTSDTDHQASWQTVLMPLVRFLPLK